MKLQRKKIGLLGEVNWDKVNIQGKLIKAKSYLTNFANEIQVGAVSSDELSSSTWYGRGRKDTFRKEIYALPIGRKWEGRELSCVHCFSIAVSAN